MTEMNPRKLADLRSAFENLGWKSDEILEALKTVKARPGIATIVMPKHYKEEAIQHAKNTAKIQKLKPGTKAYKNHFKKAYKEYLLDAWMNSRGVEIGGEGKASNPTTPKALAAYQTAVFGFGGSAFDNITKKLSNDDQKARFHRRLKGAVLSLAHIWLIYIAGWDVNRVDRPDLGLSNITTAFEFAKKTQDRSTAEKERITREISLNNMLRGVLVTFVLKSIDRLFQSHKGELEETLNEALKDIPTDFMFWPLWREKFFDTLQYVCQTGFSRIDYKEIIKETMRVMRDIGEVEAGPKAPPPPPSPATVMTDIMKATMAAAKVGDIGKANDLLKQGMQEVDQIPKKTTAILFSVSRKDEEKLKNYMEKKTKISKKQKMDMFQSQHQHTIQSDWNKIVQEEIEKEKKKP